jgi:hypothetical protein
MDKENILKITDNKNMINIRKLRKTSVEKKK